MLGWIYQKRMGTVLLASFLGMAYAGPGEAGSRTHRVLSPPTETQSTLFKDEPNSFTAACNMPAVCRKAVFPSVGSDGKNSESPGDCQTVGGAPSNHPHCNAAYRQYRICALYERQPELFKKGSCPPQ